MAKKSSKTADLTALANQAEEQFPGITELLKVYGGYDEMIIDVQRYLDATKEEPVTSTSNRSEPL